MKKVTVSDKGQIALPAAIMRRARIRPGDRLLLYERNGRILLRKGSPGRRASFEELWGALEDLWREARRAGLADPEQRLLGERRREARRS